LIFVIFFVFPYISSAVFWIIKLITGIWIWHFSLILLISKLLYILI
jgi:hypothetical protein